MQGSSTNVIIAGEQSLLIQCGEIILSRGCSIESIVSENRSIIEWADTKKIQCVENFEILRSQYSDTSVDYFFSITNLKIIPSWLLSIAKQSINIHGSLLPKYRGLNSPAWAIMNDESNHGITWHVMTDSVDKGDILIQQQFPIVPGETSLSLNAKCYQASLETFETLFDQLLAGTVEPKSQDFSDWSYYGLRDRPEAAGSIDWGKDVATIERMVRSLDYGNFENPLVTAKCLLGDKVVVVNKAKIINREEKREPGEIIACSGNALQIACVSGIIELSELRGQCGTPYPNIENLLASCGLVVGQRLNGLDSELKSELDEKVKAVCPYEKDWTRDLVNAEPISVPYASKQSSQTSKVAESVDYSLPALSSSSEKSESYILSLLSILLYRLSNKSQFSFALASDINESLEPYFCKLLPCQIGIDPQQTFSDAVAIIEKQLTLIDKRGGLLRDIGIREPLLADAPDISSYAVKVVLDDGQDEIRNERFITENLDSTELLIFVSKDNDSLRFVYPKGVLTAGALEKIISQLNSLAISTSNSPSTPIKDLNILSDYDKTSLTSWNSNYVDYDRKICIHQAFEKQVIDTPAEIALVFEQEMVNYQELNELSNKIARLLISNGAEKQSLVGVMMDRSIEMVAALIGIHKAGCAYVPLDPVYPADRLRYMIEDSGLQTLLTQTIHTDKLRELEAKVICYDQVLASIDECESSNLDLDVASDDLAYVMYTSGSTGRPKGVMVEHRNVLNFFAGMDDCIGVDKGVWLAVTSISFDISVLEIFWTLARGFKVVIYSDKSAGKEEKNVVAKSNLGIDFSLFYWNVADETSDHKQNKYNMLVESTKYADQNGFKAVWVPERHFGSFGGLFPNPSVTCSALAMVTNQIHLRAGSCVVPLHSPIRVAEEWSVVDNLSNGRVGIAVASGWAAPDFAIKPENFEHSRDIMFESAHQIQQLWRGEKVKFPGPKGDVEVRTLPRPIQSELPTWVTTAGNIETFKDAAKSGAGVLTHLLSQTFEELQEKIEAYRAAWKEAGHEGEGCVTLMLHTLIGESMEEVEEIAREPLKNYLRSAVALVKQAAWSSPTFKKMSAEAGKTLDDFVEGASEEDMDELLEFAFQRYLRVSGLFGTPETAMEVVKKCHDIGVNEIGCLIDFGIDDEIVLEHLPYLNQLRLNSNDTSAPQTSLGADSVGQDQYAIPSLLKAHKVTHFQCTPSMATMLIADSEERAHLGNIQHMMIGGEAFPTNLAEDLGEVLGGRVTNMYGPTEATIWSTVFDIVDANDISIGRPIANTQIHIVDENLQPLPVGVAGELLIGGEGVVRGYHERPELTAERFIDDSYADLGGATFDQARVYRTGDLAKFDDSGRLIYLGRVDHQVKIHGYRIELGEIEASLQTHELVRECAVILREDNIGDKRLVAYVRAHEGQHIDGENLRDYLAQGLPEFMVPTHFVELARMPLTPNGKLDRKALPKPATVRSSETDSFVQPEDDWEQLVADIWKEVLELNELSRNDNFFDIGGHSLLVIQVLKALREHEKIKKPVQMTDLFRYTTIETLAKFISSDDDSSSMTEVTSSRVAARRAAMNRRRKR